MLYDAPFIVCIAIEQEYKLPVSHDKSFSKCALTNYAYQVLARPRTGFKLSIAPGTTRGK